MRAGEARVVARIELADGARNAGRGGRPPARRPARAEYPTAGTERNLRAPEVRFAADFSYGRIIRNEGRPRRSSY